MAEQTPQAGPGPDVRLELGVTESPKTAPAMSAWETLKARFVALTQAQKLMMGAAVLALAVAGAFAALSARSSSDYRILYTNLNESDGAAILAALQQLNVPYQFTEGGGAIMIPKSALYETRLRLAGQGLPKAANVGFELLDNQKFGTSQFVEQVNYVRALEGELARSVASLEQVKSARVHLAIPKQTAFVREQEEPTASVVVALHPGRLLDRSQVAAIARLVSSSVPRLQLKNVSIVDTEGGILAPSSSQQEGLNEAQLRYTTELERALTARLASIIEPLAGKDKFRAQVAVELDFDEREKTSEVFGKNAAAEAQSIRSRQSLESQGGRSGVGGVPGALTNQPPEPPEAPIVNETNSANQDSNNRDLRAPGPIETGQSVADQPGFKRESTVNFEVDRVIDRLKASKGQIKRISAAVVLDYKATPAATAGNAPSRVPFSEGELQQIRSLARDAIGFVGSRGDTVSVVNMAFSQEPVLPTPLISPEILSQLLAYLAIAAAILFAYFAIIRPLIGPQRPNVVAKAEPIAKLDPMISLGEVTAPIAEKTEEQGEEEEEYVDPSTLTSMQRARREAAQRKVYEELLAYATEYAGKNPIETSLLLRAWLNEKPHGLDDPKPTEHAV